MIIINNNNIIINNQWRIVVVKGRGLKGLQLPPRNV